MRNALALLAVCCIPASAITPGYSPAMEQAGQIQPTVGSYTYDNARPYQSSYAVPAGPAGTDDPCAQGGCGLRRGGPSPVLSEPSNPVRAIENEEAAKKSQSSGGSFGWLKSPMVLAGGGALVGGLTGYFLHATVLGFALKGGLMGGLIGAAIGAIVGLIVSKFL